MKITHKTGVTLVELIIVILVTSILAAVAIPRLGSVDQVVFNAAVRKLVTELRYLQQLAISEHANISITFNTTDEQYSSAAIDPFTRQPISVNFKTDPKFRGILIDTASFGGTNILQFDWRGVPLNGSGVELTSEGSLQISFKNNAYRATVYVQEKTGRVRVQ